MPDGTPLEAQRFDLPTIADTLGMTRRAVEMRASRESWSFAEESVRGGKKRLFELRNLPSEVRAALLLKHTPKSTPTPKPTRTQADLIAASERLDRLSENQRASAERRARAVAAVANLAQSGVGLMQARQLVAAELQREGVRGASVASLCRWSAVVVDAPRDTWAALLAADYHGRISFAVCDLRAQDWYFKHYLSRRQPSHADAYERMCRVAKKEGWQVPSARTMIRRLDEQVDRVTQVYKREGPEAAARLIPTQDRDALVFSAGQAVNGDGLKFDKLWVRYEDGEVINTATAWFYQDIRTRKMLAWRLAKTENTDVFRLATYDLTALCAPEHVWIDNTRVAANKQMSAGAAGRHRFKSDPEDGEGLLRMLGMDPHFTNPDKLRGNPGAKPIERSFGQGGLHDMVATHPKFVDRGYSKKTAIDVAELRAVIAEEVARHNARPNRRTQACNGVLSFDQAWQASIAQSQPRVLSDAQRRLLLTSREVVTADARSGLVTIKAGRGPMGRNRYYSDGLSQLAGTKVVVHYDPENLSADVHIYGLDGRYLCTGQHQPTEAFNSTEAGREHAKFKQRQLKAQKAAADAATRMSSLELAGLYEKAQPLPADPQPAADPKVVQGHFRRMPDPERDAQRATGTDGPSALDRMMRDKVRKLREDSEF